MDSTGVASQVVFMDIKVDSPVTDICVFVLPAGCNDGCEVGEIFRLKISTNAEPELFE